ncbi:MAG: division/cell wall cluster transcriptional repressor MraZ [Spirochaetae bacterium HGW-Spirochaetae-1]|jgi:MraZ protein|nr:MAG: division/cell wall cluster transcriptional repressor MraZ [Spirochaetae bacterium HGW-Spirochaetae-1]
MFMGEYHPALDEKGRVAVPMRLRRAYGGDVPIDKLIITHGFDKCIMAFRENDWREFVEKKLMPLPQADPKNRMRLRFLLGGASECELDKQGRLIIPPYLQDYAGIRKDLTILGMYDRIEIWSEEVYREYKPSGDSLESFASELGF